MAKFVQTRFSVAATLAVLAGLGISAAAAQSSSAPEGAAAPQRRSHTPITYNCGHSAKSIVVIHSDFVNIRTDPEEFVKLAGADATFTISPRVTRCIRSSSQRRLRAQTFAMFRPSSMAL
jgi:hypothetical protein